MVLRSWLVVSLVAGGLLIARASLAQPADDPAALPPPPPQPAPPPSSPPPSAMQPLPPQPIVASPLARTHHGVFVRMLLGPGGFRTTSTQGTDKYEVSGSGGGFGLAVGGAVSPSLVVYGALFDDIASSPTFTMNGQSSGTANDVRAGVVGFGPGVAYYFPSNVYIGGTLAAARLTVQQNGQEVAHSDTGFGVDLHVGKEWWVSDGWGIGIAGQLFVGTIPDGQANTSWKTAGGTLAFSATYN